MIDNQPRWTVVSGGRVHYFVEGMEQGNRVVLLHGASFSAETWNSIGTMKVLAQAGFLVYAVDLPGFGKSAAGHGSPRTWLKELLELLQIDQPVVVSPSMSGRFALPLVTKESQRVSGWVAVAPVGIMNYKDQLKNITTPVLAVWGEHDRVVPLEQADLLVQSVKHGRKVIIPGGSHAPYMSDPAAFHAELLKFLAELAINGVGR